MVIVNGSELVVLSPEEEAAFEEWSDPLARFSITRLEERRGAKGWNQWVYPELVCNSYTFIEGREKSGKSLLAANLAARFSRGEDFLGVPLVSGSVGSRRVLVVGTEANLESEWGDRVTALGGDRDGVAIVQLSTGQDVPEYCYRALARGLVGLVIVDNSSGFVAGDGQRDDQSPTRLKKLFDPFVSDGVPVVVIHHHNKGGVSTGSVQYAAMGRWFLQMSKTSSGFRVKRPGGNFAPAPGVDLVREGYRLFPVGAAVCGGEEAPARREVSEEKRRIYELAIEAPAGSKSAVARWVMEELARRGCKNARGTAYRESAVRSALNRAESSEGSPLVWVEELRRYVVE